MKFLNTIAGAGFLLQAFTPVHAGELISPIASTTTEFKVINSAEAEVTISGRKDLAAGSVGDGFRVASWTATVTAGTVAYRINSSINSDVKDGRFATSKNTETPSKVLHFRGNHTADGTTTLINGWRVFSQGTTSVQTGVIEVDKAQVLVPGHYPIGIDVAAYAF